MLPILFFIIIVGGPLFATVIYRHNGKRQIFNIDLIQFIYGFVLGPIAFLWLKTFLFYLFKNELGLSLSINELFFIDTFFSIVLIYLLMAIAIHSVTKSFWLKKNQDPLYDVFRLSEYFHLWFTHIFIFVGSLILMIFLSISNLFIPLQVIGDKRLLFIVLFVGFIFGIGWFFGVWLSDPKQERKNFLRLIKLCSAVFFIFQVALFFISDPSFSLKYLMYWFMLSTSFSIVTAFTFFHRFARIRQVRDWLLHAGWGDNIELFEKEAMIDAED